jgi:pimeloyl-ACP methyl ester carboxylesterase
MRCLIFNFLLLIVSTICFGQTPKKAETATLKDCRLHYEVYGEGEPLFLLHGFCGSFKYWKSYVHEFEDDFEVYLVDLTGHGKSSNFSDEISIPEAAVNLHSLIQYLGLEKVKGIGLSYGGDVLFHLAANNPDMFHSIIAIGGLGTWNANDFPDWIEYFSYKNIANLQWIKAYQPDETRAKWLLDHFSSYVVSLSDEALANIKTNTLIVLGDNDDSIPLTEVIRVRNLLSSSALWIVPNTGHVANAGKNKKDFVRISKDFLNQ